MSTPTPDKDTPEKDIAAAHEPPHSAHRDQFPSLLSSSAGSSGLPPFRYQPQSRVTPTPPPLPPPQPPPTDTTAARRRTRSRFQEDSKLSLLFWFIIACCNLYVLIGCGALDFFYQLSSIQSNYEKIVKYIVLIYIILELLFRVLTVYHVQDFVKTDLNILEAIVIILFKKEGYFLFGKYILTTTQITTLANTSESLVFIILSLLVIHLWFILKESNPIFNTEEISRKVEISLAVPVALLVLTRCIGYKSKSYLQSSRTVGGGNLPTSGRGTDGNIHITNIESEEAIRAEEKEMRRIESRYSKCIGCCNGCCGNVTKYLCRKCDLGIFDCNGFIGGCFGGFLDFVFASCRRRRADENA